MENKLKMRKVKHFIFAILGYSLGTTISDRILNKNGITKI